MIDLAFFDDLLFTDHAAPAISTDILIELTGCPAAGTAPLPYGFIQLRVNVSAAMACFGGWKPAIDANDKPAAFPGGRFQDPQELRIREV